MKNQVHMAPTHTSENSGAAVYTKLVLSLYDLFVLGLSNHFAWKCSTKKILDFYNNHVTDHHLEVGVGTGYFLDKCQFPSQHLSLTLLDLNPHCLEVTTRRIARYRPKTLVANVLKPIPLNEKNFTSIGLGYLLHCLPGNMQDKAKVFEHLKPLMGSQGVIFGTTILGGGIEHNFLGRKLMNLYNKKGIFGNQKDSATDLEKVLSQNFKNYKMNIEGRVAFFAGWI